MILPAFIGSLGAIFSAARFWGVVVRLVIILPIYYYLLSQVVAVFISVYGVVDSAGGPGHVKSVLGQVWGVIVYLGIDRFIKINLSFLGLSVTEWLYNKWMQVWGRV